MREMEPYCADMSEHRIAPRQRVLKTGIIEFDGGLIDCAVRNLSNTGAALSVESLIGIPSDFELVFANLSSRTCRVVWRKQNRVGVTFI